MKNDRGVGLIGFALGIRASRAQQTTAVFRQNRDGQVRRHKRGRFCTAAAAAGYLSFALVSTVCAGTFTVNSTADTSVCSDNGECTLRGAILRARASTGANLIAFNIAGNGIHTIAPAIQLPDIDTPVTIDGSTQTGYQGSPVIEINGANFSDGARDGLRVVTSNCVIRALAVTGFRSVLDP